MYKIQNYFIAFPKISYLRTTYFLDAEMKQSANALCVMAEGKEDSDPVFQYKRGKQIK